MEETSKNWIIFGLILFCAILLATSYNKSEKIQYLNTRCENLDTMLSEKDITIKSLNINFKECQENLETANSSYTQLYMDYEKLEMALDSCRNIKFNPNNGKKSKIGTKVNRISGI